MRISAIKLFDLATIKDEKVRVEVQPFVEYVNNALDQLIRLSNKQTTFADNIDSEQIEISIKHNSAKDAVVRQPERIIGVIALKVYSATDAVNSLAWKITNDGGLSLTAMFKEAAADARKVRFLIIYG